MSSDAGIAVGRVMAYARQGWPVFPCKPGRKEPDTPHGFKDATIDPRRIAAWWTAVPGRNVAIATGAPGPDVLDVDVRPDGSGYPALRRLRQAGLLEGSLAIVATPGGGLHAYYTGTRQGSRRLAAHHLDFKAAGGYVLAPPSAVGGKPYQVIQHQGQANRACLDWDAVAGLLDPPQQEPQSSRQREAPRDAGRLAGWVAGLREGNRNAGLFWAACRAAETGRSDALDALAEAAGSAGLPEDEIWRTIASARRSTRCRSPVRERRQHGAEAGPEPNAQPEPEAMS